LKAAVVAKKAVFLFLAGHSNTVGYEKKTKSKQISKRYSVTNGI
jgi:hypothetical protein